MQTFRPALVPLLLSLVCARCPAATPKVHTVTLGAMRRVPYTPPEAGAANKSEESTTLRVRPLFVDDRQKEWTVGEIHDVTDRSFVVRRALRINDSLPGEVPRWSWQPGPWLMVDRTTGHITALHLPAFDPEISQVAWFRDYAAYCGITTATHSLLVAVVVELGARKPAVQKGIENWPMPDAPIPVCALPVWQRSPMRATIQATGGAAMTFEVVGTSSLIEENEGAEP
jgi:hypothetical protein